MNIFLEFDEDKKTIKSLDLNDFSVVDLEEYIDVLKLEIKRANEEIFKREKSKNEANNFFK